MFSEVIAETFTQLRKSVGVASSPIHAFHFKPEAYRSTTTVAAIDFEKALQVSYTGTSTRAGDLLVDQAKPANNGTTGAQNPPQKLLLTMHADVIPQIAASGVILFD